MLLTSLISRGDIFGGKSFCCPYLFTIFIYSMYHANLRNIHNIEKNMSDFLHITIPFFFFIYIYTYLTIFIITFFLLSKYDSQVKKYFGCLRQIEMIITCVTKLIKLAKYPR